jgi:hypothetical protein
MNKLLGPEEQAHLNRARDYLTRYMADEPTPKLSGGAGSRGMPLTSVISC